ncbi:hypothetical protein ACFRMQ_39645 [Kitasatospora sp. NPDC056783]|uniref:hypothetical protein n=1 Tax=Kitasatospora sp. NPDC056783 TaxID=3345943 RepID=UPI0036B04255
MSLRGKIRKLAVIVAVAGAVVTVPTSAMAGGTQSEEQILQTGTAGVGLFGPHATWFNYAEAGESDCGC